MRYRVVDRPDFTVVGLKARVPLVHAGPNQAIIDFVRGIDPADPAQSGGAGGPGARGHRRGLRRLDPSRAEGTELDYYHGVITRRRPPRAPRPSRSPAGAWAVFTTSGPAPRAIQELWRDVFTEWFLSTPYRSRPGPEILRTRLSADGTEADAELWLPVEREQGRNGAPSRRRLTDGARPTGAADRSGRPERPTGAAGWHGRPARPAEVPPASPGHRTLTPVALTLPAVPAGVLRLPDRVPGAHRRSRTPARRRRRPVPSATPPAPTVGACL
ncbi:GyrI-like domain-containing protein [Streptomyces tricolor]|nr:GyrI-like domain-containing protein [Streptomyces tricolor]